jgi:hypothetical protein
MPDAGVDVDCATQPADHRQQMEVDMSVRNVANKLVTIMCGALIAAPLIIVSAGPAAADGMSELGIRLRDDGGNGQCVTRDHRIQDYTQWVSEGTWTEPLVIDTDDRSGGCELWFGTNNKDGSLTGLHLNYTFFQAPGPSTGECPSASDKPMAIPIFPFAFDFQFMQGSPIVIDTDTPRNSYCKLRFDMEGSTRSDVALDVKYEFNGDGGQCQGGHLLDDGTDPYVVDVGHSLEIGLNTSNAGGACFLSFRMHRR